MKEMTDRKITGDGEVDGGGSFVGNWSEVTGEIVMNLGRVVAELDDELLEQVDELGSKAFVRLRIHRHNFVAGARLLRRHFRHGFALLCSGLLMVGYLSPTSRVFCFLCHVYFREKNIYINIILYLYGQILLI